VKIWLTAIACALAVAAAVYLLVSPVYSGFSDNQPVRATVVQVNGLWSLVPVSFPIFLTVVPLAVPHKKVRIAVAVLLCAFVYLGGMTIGLYYAPAAVMLLLAACAPDSARLRDAVQ
jgi:hypothetical protein